MIILTCKFIDNNKISKWKKYFLELLNFLTNEEKTIMIMKYSNDFSNKEISEALNLSEGTIRTKLYRIKRKMREKYEDNRY